MTDKSAAAVKEFAEKEKRVHVKPGMYSLFFYNLKEIAKQYGYNLVLHGSMNRDLDLVAIPWSDDMKSEQDMIMEFQCYLTGHTIVMPGGGVHYATLPGNRHSYVIDLNRGNKKGEWSRYDEQYYLDISVVQTTALISEHYVSKEEYNRVVRQLQSQNPFPGRPNPRDVNPYDSRAIKRSRKK